MCFRNDCLDRLPERLANAPDVLVFPREVNISRTHELGDLLLSAVSGQPQVRDVHPLDFVVTKYTVAIGGAQICLANAVREIGYNGMSANLMKPILRWERCRDDVSFRQTLSTGGEPIDLPGVYRIRHDCFGRRDENGQRVASVDSKRCIR